MAKVRLISLVVVMTVFVSIVAIAAATQLKTEQEDFSHMDGMICEGGVFIFRAGVRRVYAKCQNEDDVCFLYNDQMSCFNKENN